jgi:hypothetical protein
MFCARTVAAGTATGYCRLDISISGPAVRQHPGPGTESLTLDARRLSLSAAAHARRVHAWCEKGLSMSRVEEASDAAQRGAILIE